MAQIKLLKIAADGIPVEFDSAADEITLASFTVQGGAVLSVTGLDMNNTDISDVQDLSFTDPSTSTIVQTAGAVVVDDLMAKDRANVMKVDSDILFPVVTDDADEIDAFRVPSLAGAPTATPTAGGEGFLVFDSVNKDLHIWTGTEWDNLNTVDSAKNIEDDYVAEVSVAARDVVYISSADNVSPASSSTAAAAQAVGFAIAAASPAAPVSVKKFGRIDGFTGLTPTARYYLSTSAGQITSSIPTGSGNTIVQVGYAKNATTLDIMIQSLGRRA